jgi:hypothetical protein
MIAQPADTTAAQNDAPFFAIALVKGQHGSTITFLGNTVSFAFGLGLNVPAALNTVRRHRCRSSTYLHRCRSSKYLHKSAIFTPPDSSTALQMALFAMADWGLGG